MRRLARWTLVLLVLEFLLALAFGLWLRARLEAPVRVLGLLPAAQPLHVGHAGPAVLDPRQREEQVG
jgi:hypothetical protein